MRHLLRICLMPPETKIARWCLRELPPLTKSCIRLNSTTLTQQVQIASHGIPHIHRFDLRYCFRTAISSATSTSSSCYPDPRPPDHVSESSRPQPTAAPLQQSCIYSSRLYPSNLVIALTIHRSMLRSSSQLASGTKASRQAHCTLLYLSMHSNNAHASEHDSSLQFGKVYAQVPLISSSYTPSESRLVDNPHLSRHLKRPTPYVRHNLHVLSIRADRSETVLPSTEYVCSLLSADLLQRPS